MTVTDKNNIKTLFYFYRYNKAVIARLYGLSPTRIKAIIAEQQSVTAIPMDDCLLCDLDEAKMYFIDGNDNNNKPQNKIMLCQACVVRIEHLQIRKRNGILTSQY